jgi:hypothetical protein
MLWWTCLVVLFIGSAQNLIHFMQLLAIATIIWLVSIAITCGVLSKDFPYCSRTGKRVKECQCDNCKDGW